MEASVALAWKKSFRGLGLPRNHAASHVALSSFEDFVRKNDMADEPVKTLTLVARLMLVDAHLKFSKGAKS